MYQHKRVLHLRGNYGKYSLRMYLYGICEGKMQNLIMIRKKNCKFSACRASYY